MKTRLVAGIDSSTQSCKVVVCDARSGKIVRSGRAPHPDGTEIDPEAWWSALGAAVTDAGGIDDVAAVSVAAQQHGLVALDADGRVVREALLWNDTRSAPEAADLVAELGADAWAERTGVVPVASFTAAKLRWVRDHEPQNAARMAAVALPHDWLSWRLRGYGPAATSPLGPELEMLATDASDASGTAYWSPRTRQYDRGLFAAAFGRPIREAGEGSRADAGDVVIVPRVIRHDRTAGVLDGDVQLPGGATAPAGLVVGPGAGDNAAAALGLGLLDGDVALSLGTSGTAFGVASDLSGDRSGTVAGFADAAGRRLPIVTTLNAARILDYFGDIIGVTHDELGRLAMQAPAGADGLVLVPYFIGERTPNRPDATASLLGMTPDNMTRGHIARAAIEGMLGSLAEGVAAMRERGLNSNRLLIIGGAARNEAVAEIAAQMFGQDVEVPAAGEYVAYGAALQAAWSLTRRRPNWSVESRVVRKAPEPAIMRAYRAAAARADRAASADRQAAAHLAHPSPVHDAECAEHE